METKPDPSAFSSARPGGTGERLLPQHVALSECLSRGRDRNYIHGIQLGMIIWRAEHGSMLPVIVRLIRGKIEGKSLFAVIKVR